MCFWPFRLMAVSKADLCTQGADGREPTVGYCWLREGKTTDVDYTSYVRAIPALLACQAREQSLFLPNPRPFSLSIAPAYCGFSRVWSSRERTNDFASDDSELSRVAS